MQFGQHARFLPPFVQGMKNSRSREIFPRNANYHGEEDGRIRIRQRGEREGGKNVDVEKGGEELSMLGSPKHPRRPMHARFFP